MDILLGSDVGISIGNYVGHWAFLGFLDMQTRGQYPRSDEIGNYFAFSSSDIVRRKVIPSEDIAAPLDKYVPAGMPDKDSAAIIFSQTVCTINVQTLSDPSKRSIYEHQKESDEGKNILY